MRTTVLLITLIWCSLTATSSHAQKKIECPADLVLDVNLSFRLPTENRQVNSLCGSSFISTENDTLSFLGTMKNASVSTRFLSECSGDIDQPIPFGLTNVVGCLERTFRNNKDSTTCTQQVWLVNSKPFSETSIIWPEDFDWPEDVLAFSIDSTDYWDDDFFTDPDPEYMTEHGIESRYIEPSFPDLPYSLIGVTYEDTIFGNGLNPEKIIRVWAIIDWCQYDVHHNGMWYHKQTITFKQ
jgi:hypothetical protein